jgi:hypothetical protein
MGIHVMVEGAIVSRDVVVTDILDQQGKGGESFYS